MTEVEQIEQQVARLPADELAKFRAWFMEFDSGVWERRVEAEFQARGRDGGTTQPPTETSSR